MHGGQLIVDLSLCQSTVAVSHLALDLGLVLFQGVEEVMGGCYDRQMAEKVTQARVSLHQ